MKKELLILLAIVFHSTICFAQDREQRKFNPKEFQQRFEAFTAEQAGFTKEEAAKFFAIYNQKKEQERTLYRQTNELVRKTDLKNATDKEITLALNRMTALDASKAKLEQEFTKNARKVISDRKFLLFKAAETRFQARELREMERHREMERRRGSRQPNRK